MATKYIFPGEDHTFGGLITTLLRQNPEVVYTAYTLDEETLTLFLDANDPQQCLQLALTEGLTLVATVRTKIQAAACAVN